VVATAPAIADASPPAVERYRPDAWGLWFWLACAAVLVGLDLLDCLAAIWRKLF
jgi:hypothetical protein